MKFDLYYLLLQKESEWLDFKREYSNNNIDLVHDVICLANAETPKNRLLVFGIADDLAVVGVEHDAKRKKQSDILNLLRDTPFNSLPKIILHTVPYEGHEIDILEIENRPEKPYFLKKDKSFQGKTIRAGVVYTRYGDTNTPLQECADELHLERMFRERFGLDKSPLQRVKISLRDVTHWKWGEDENNESYFHDEWNPEFTLCRRHTSLDDFKEGWSLSFPDSKAYKYELLLKYHTTLLKRMYVVSCDGGRYLTVLPSYWLYEDREKQRYYMSYFFVRDSLEYLVNRMILEVYPGQSSRGWLKPFPVFSSKEEAENELRLDFDKGMHDYIYYFFDQTSQRYVSIQNGQSKQILTC